MGDAICSQEAIQGMSWLFFHLFHAFPYSSKGLFYGLNNTLWGNDSAPGVANQESGSLAACTSFHFQMDLAHVDFYSHKAFYPLCQLSNLILWKRPDRN
jgi:hypothetical protein